MMAISFGSDLTLEIACTNQTRLGGQEAVDGDSWAAHVATWLNNGTSGLPGRPSDDGAERGDSRHLSVWRGVLNCAWR